MLFYFVNLNVYISIYLENKKNLWKDLIQKNTQHLNGYMKIHS